MARYEHAPVARYPIAKERPCRGCGGPFAMDPGGWKKTPMVVETIEDPIFRGDDEVHFYHPGCAPEGATKGR